MPNSRSRSIVQGSARALVGLVGVAVALVVLLGATLIPVPGFRVTPPSSNVEPVPADQVRVCPGPLLDLADATDASSLSIFGSPMTVMDATSGIHQRHLSSQAHGPGPRVISTQGSTSGQRSLIAGAQWQTASQSDIAGLAAAACGEAGSDSWLVAGSTMLGATSLVLLSNPTAVEATVDLTVYSEAGKADAPGARGLIVRADSQLVVPLAGIVPNVQASVVHVQATGGSVYASLQESEVQGLSPQGVELVGPTAAPARTQVIAGMTVANSARLSAPGDDPSAVLPSVRLLAPGTAPVHVTVTASPDTATGTPATQNLTLQGGTVREAVFSRLRDGAYTVRVTADAPVVAAAHTVDPAAAPAKGESATARAEAASQDFAWFEASAPLQSTAMLSIPGGGSPVLHLVNPGATAATVTLTPLPGGDPQQATVPSDGQVSVSVRSQASYSLSGVQGLLASVSLTSDAASSSFSLNPPGPLAQPITVYPR